MKVAIVEDNPAIRQTLKRYLQRTQLEIEIVFEADSVDTAVDGFSSHNVDLAFLDVEIKGGLIFEALDKVESLNFEAIFVSSHGTYALDAFRYSALNYILKPLDYDQLIHELLRFEQKVIEKSSVNVLKKQVDFLKSMLQEPKTEKIALPSMDGISFHRFDQIMWVEADANYCQFYLKGGDKVLVSKPMKEFSDLLEGHGFYRTHKSSMVNLTFVDRYIKGAGGMVILADGTEIQVSRRKKEGLLEALS